MANDGTVKIGVEIDPKELEQSFKEVEKRAEKTAQELKKVDEALKLDPKNVELLTEKQKVLNTALSDAKTKAQYFSAELKKAKENGLDQSDADAYRELVIQMSKAEAEAKDFEGQLKGVNDQIKNGGEASKSFATEITDFGKAAAAAAAVAVAGLLALESSTEEYRIAQGKLNTAFEAAGYSGETAQKAYKGFYEILGDTDTATESAQLLAKLAHNAEDVSTWIGIAAGVSGTFGDALPINSLIESANETSRVAKVTGVFADALNWAGISEDEFNKKLEACTDESERNRLIMDTLSATYDDASDAFYRNNAALVESRQTQAELDNVLSQIGGSIATVKSEVLTGLLPAFQNLASGVNWDKLSGSVSDFLLAIIQNGPTIVSIVSAIGGSFAAMKITSIVQAAIPAIQSLVTALGSATAAQTGLNVAMSANPIGAVAAAAGALIGILSSLAINSSLAADEVSNLTSSVENARSEYASLSAEIEQNASDTVSMALALEQLVEQEEKTAAQKEAILSLVESLNEAVPGLTLAYDEQTDSLNMTTEAIKRLAEAEYQRAQKEAAIDRLKEAYTEQIELTNALAEAERDLAEAEAMSSDPSTAGKRYDEIVEAQEAIDEYTAALEDNQAEIESLEEQYSEFSANIEENTEAVEKSAAASDNASSSFSYLSSVLDSTQGAFQLLRQAEDEASESGYVSLDTVQSLIEKYPELESYLIATAGGYKIADGAAQDYIATQKAEYQIALNEAQTAANKIAEAEATKINALGMTTATAQEQLKALAKLYESMADTADTRAQSGNYMRKANEYRKAAEELASAQTSLANFERVSASLFRDYAVSTPKTTTTKTSKSSSTQKTQAELNVEAYKEAVKQLDHQRNMDLISEEDYYKQKEALGKKYLTAGSDEQMSLEEEIYKWEKEQREDALKAEEEALEEEKERKLEAYKEQRDALEKSYEDQKITTEEYLSELNRIQSEYLEEGTDDWIEAVEFRNEEIERLQDDFFDDFSDSLQSIGDEYSSSISEIESAQQSLADKLAGTGELFTESTSGKLRLTDLQDGIDQIEEYGEALDELKERGISESLLSEILSMDVDDATAYMEKLLSMTDSKFKEYNSLWEEKQRLSKEIAEKFYQDQMDALESEFVDNLSSALSEVPETMEDIGKEAIQAWIEGFESEQPSAMSAVQRFFEALDVSSVGVSFANASMAPAAAYTPQFSTENAITQAAGMATLASAGGDSREIVLNLNGTEVARALVPDIRAVEDQSPRIVSDSR